MLQGRKNSEEAQEYRVKKNNEVGEAKIRVRGTGNGNKKSTSRYAQRLCLLMDTVCLQKDKMNPVAG
jgi:hypothetical protein